MLVILSGNFIILELHVLLYIHWNEQEPQMIAMRGGARIILFYWLFSPKRMGYNEKAHATNGPIKVPVFKSTKAQYHSNKSR